MPDGTPAPRKEGISLLSGAAPLPHGLQDLPGATRPYADGFPLLGKDQTGYMACSKMALASSSVMVRGLLASRRPALSAPSASKGMSASLTP